MSNLIHAIGLNDVSLIEVNDKGSDHLHLVRWHRQQTWMQGGGTTTANIIIIVNIITNTTTVCYAVHIHL